MMNPRDGYLESEVYGASPAKLQLMLIEAAMRAAEHARQHWHDGKNQAACELLIHSQEIVTEMTAGLNREAQPELAAKLAAIYLFVFRTLVEANLNRSEKQLDDALRILAIERDTWRAACEKLKRGAEPAAAPPPRSGSPLPPHFASQPDSAPSGFSLEA